jgi:hypothetical protein
MHFRAKDEVVLRRLFWNACRDWISGASTIAVFPESAVTGSKDVNLLDFNGTDSPFLIL